MKASSEDTVSISEPVVRKGGKGTMAGFAQEAKSAMFSSLLSQVRARGK